MLTIKKEGACKLKTQGVSDRDNINSVETPEVLFTHEVLRKFYGDFNIELENTGSRLWNQPSVISTINSGNARVTEIPYNCNAVQVALSFLCADAIDGERLTHESDFILLSGMTLLNPSETEGELACTGFIGSKCLVDANSGMQNPDAYAYRTISYNGTNYQEKFAAPMLFPTKGYKFVMPTYIGCNIQYWANPAKIKFVRIWTLPCFYPYIREGY